MKVGFLPPQDVVFPYMVDTRIPEDTLFFLCEEDFRFWPEKMDWVPSYAARADKVVDQGPRCPTGEPTATRRRAGEETPADRRHPGKGKGKTPVRGTSYHQTQERGNVDPTAGPNWGLSQEVADCIRIATFAHRQKVGNIIWCTYNIQGWPKWAPTNGSALLMFSKQGAREILRNLNEPAGIKKGDIDLVMKSWLKRMGNEYMNEIGFSIVTPPIGHFFSHASDCDPKNFGSEGKIRHATWDAPWVAPGTRVCDDDLHESAENRHRQKYLCQWTKKSVGHFKEFPPDMRLHQSEEFLWRSWEDATLRPPDAVVGEPTATASKKARGSVQRDGVSALGPPGPRKPGRIPEQAPQPPGKAPGSPPVLGCTPKAAGAPPAVTGQDAAASQPPPPPEAEAQQEKLCGRRQRLMRMQNRRRNFRVWADSREQAGSWWYVSDNTC